MRAFYKEGFLLLKTGKPGPVFIAPHSTMTLLAVTRGDVSSELITARLIRKLGGFGIISTVPRKGRYGIDYFRESATMEEAVKMFHASKNNGYDLRYRFEKKYAFFARDEEEYLEKSNAYNQFWTTVETLAPKNPVFVLMHSQGTRMKNFPSLLDITTLDGEWMNEEKVRSVLAEINDKNKNIFESLKTELKKYACSWAELWLKNAVLYRFGEFELKKLQGAYKVTIEDDVKKAAALLKQNPKPLIKNLTWKSYINLIEECVKKSNFEVTYQNAFNGEPGRARIRKLLDHCGGEAVLFETSTFLNETHPNVSIRLVADVLSAIERKDKLKRFEKFLKP
jgi:hypothetical protein